MAGGLNHGTFARGSVLWGMGFAPQIITPPNDPNSITLHYVQGTTEVVVGTVINMNGVMSASDANFQNAFMPVPMALEFLATTSISLTLTFDVVGRNQFGDTVSESVTVTTGTLQAYTKHCYSFVESITPTVVTNWNAVDDTLQIGFDHNIQIDCPYPLPFRVIGADNIQAITIAGNVFDGSDIVVSKLYHTVTVKNSATTVIGLAELTPATLSLVNGAAMVY